MKKKICGVSPKKREKKTKKTSYSIFRRDKKTCPSDYISTQCAGFYIWDDEICSTKQILEPWTFVSSLHREFNCTSSRYHSRFFAQVGHETTYASSGNKRFFTKSCHCLTYQNYQGPPWSHYIVTSLVWIRRELGSLLLPPNYADAHTQHNKKVDQHQNGKMN